MYDLKSLIQASGYSGVSGQSFRNHVTGATTGTAMSDYKCWDWSFSGGPAESFTYFNSQSFAIDISFTENSKAHLIKRKGTNVLGVDPTYGPDYTGTPITSNDAFGIIATSHSVDDFGTGTLYVKLAAPMDPATGFAGTAWFTGYNMGNSPTYDGTNPDPVTFKGSVAGGTSGGTPMLQAFSVTYRIDNGTFNAGHFTSGNLYKTFPITMNKRATDTSTTPYDWEWHNNSTYTDLYTTSPTFVVYSAPQDSFTFYLRVKPKSSSTWQNQGAVTFDDPRLM